MQRLFISLTLAASVTLWAGCVFERDLGPLDDEGATSASCTDGIDNDGDGEVDCADPGCATVCTPVRTDAGGETSATCRCGTSETCCREACVDILVDPQHCGGCGILCDGICTQGICSGSVDLGRPVGEYRFVRIDDYSEDDATLNGGADIDAVILHRRDGSQYFASTVEAYLHGGGFAEGHELDPTHALGPPDSFFDYPDLSYCDGEYGFVSLGGIGGYVVVEMAGSVTPGDLLEVLEVGECDFGGGVAISEPIGVALSLANDPGGTWEYIGEGWGPSILIPVPDLP